MITIPDAQDGNICRKTNAILEHSPADWTLVVDDDLSAIGYYERNQHYWPEPEFLAHFILNAFLMAEDLHVKLWGLNQYSDPMGYKTGRPFSLLSPILGPFKGVIRNPLRFDERLPLKEDYDYWLQHVQRYRKTLRFQKWHYYHDHGKEPGGVVSQRTMADEQAQFDLLQQKWGADIVKRPGGSSGGRAATGRNILNTVVRLPIPGC